MSYNLNASHGVPLLKKPLPVGLTAVALVALFGLVAGLASALLAAFFAPSAPVIAASSSALAAGWIMLSLWSLSHRRWVVGGAMAAVLAVGVTLLSLATTSANVDPRAAYALGAVEAIVAGGWLAQTFSLLERPGLTEGLAACVFLLLVAVLVLPGVLPAVYPGLLALVMAAPVMAVTLAARPRRPGVPLAWLLAAAAVLPASLAVAYLAASAAVL